MKSLLLLGGLLLVPSVVFGQGNRAIDYKAGMPFSQAMVAGNTLYVAGTEGPAVDGPMKGKLEGVSIQDQTSNAIAGIQRTVEKAGFKMADLVSVTVFIADLDDVPAMNAVYTKLMPNPKPARATVKVAGLIGNAKIEISAIAVKQ